MILCKSGMSNFSPRENRFYEISLREHGREILPSKSPYGREKRHSPFKISLGEFEGRISFQNLPSEERKYFLGRIWNLPWKFKIEINVFWPLEVKMAHIIWDIYQIIDIWWAIIGTVCRIIRVLNINSDLKNSNFLIFLGNRFSNQPWGAKDIEKLKGDFEFSRDFLTKGDFWEKIYSPFSKGRFWKKILLSLRRREIFKGENLFSLPKGDFEGRISLRILPITEGRK